MSIRIDVQRLRRLSPPPSAQRASLVAADERQNYGALRSFTESEAAGCQRCAFALDTTAAANLLG
jgi:hypothetical protein